MTKVFVKWVPRRNTEKSAIHKHGDTWLVNSTNVVTDKVLISPSDSRDEDLRWIFKDQIVETF